MVDTNANGKCVFRHQLYPPENRPIYLLAKMMSVIFLHSSCNYSHYDIK